MTAKIDVFDTCRHEMTFRIFQLETSHFLWSKKFSEAKVFFFQKKQDGTPTTFVGTVRQKLSAKNLITSLYIPKKSNLQNTLPSRTRFFLKKTKTKTKFS